MKKIIYDIGSNNGDDIPYYLKKADLVVAIEANPTMCDLIRMRFSSEIKQRRLILEPCVITDKPNSGTVDFYVHKTISVLSQFPKPLEPESFQKILIPSKSVIEIIQEYGNPYYIKIDIEHFDAEILRVLFQNEIRPPYISAESHDIEIFALFVALGKYDAFKVVEGSLVSQLYYNHRIKTTTIDEYYSFPHHSAGPFGEDISGPWITSNDLFMHLASVGLGWKDIHATTNPSG